MTKTTEIDALIAAYAKRLEGIYEQRTAGDYTFTGVLAMFSIELSQLVAEQARAEAESDAETRTAVQVITWNAPSDQSAEKHYRVIALTPAGGTAMYACTCAHYVHRLEICKHITRVREGLIPAHKVQYYDTVDEALDAHRKSRSSFQPA